MRGNSHSGLSALRSHRGRLRPRGVAYTLLSAVNLYEAQHLAEALLREHGLTEWRFRFDHARRRFGSCRPTHKLITLSRPLTLLNSLEQVRDTILHEIAHALAPDDGHGPRWRAACRRVGARPVRCYAADGRDGVVSPPRRAARYRIGCTTCGWWTERRRLSRRTLVCRACRQTVTYRDQSTGRLFVIEQDGRAARVRYLGAPQQRRS